jgi:hypothetical protein
LLFLDAEKAETREQSVNHAKAFGALLSWYDPGRLAITSACGALASWKLDWGLAKCSQPRLSSRGAYRDGADWNVRLRNRFTTMFGSALIHFGVVETIVHPRKDKTRLPVDGTIWTLLSSLLPAVRICLEACRRTNHTLVE